MYVDVIEHSYLGNGTVKEIMMRENVGLLTVPPTYLFYMAFFRTLRRSVLETIAMPSHTAASVLCTWKPKDDFYRRGFLA
jgi:hypothetical protein